MAALSSATRSATYARASGPKTARRIVAVRAAAPVKEEWVANLHAVDDAASPAAPLPRRITREGVCALEAELDAGEGVAALRRFNAALRAVGSKSARADGGAGASAADGSAAANINGGDWQRALQPLFLELCFNLESFNPAFAACLLQVQRTIGASDYVRRDTALKNLIQPLAGEYGMHNGLPQLKTHRELFSDFYASLFGSPLADLLASSPAPVHAPLLYRRMMRDILSAGGRVRDDFSSPDGGRAGDSLAAASYALGYNLAIEYLADYEKTWMLDSFRFLVGDDSPADPRPPAGSGASAGPGASGAEGGGGGAPAPAGGALARAGVERADVDWVFLEVHAEGEAEHAAIGHSAVLALVPEADAPLLRRAMADHDRDFAEFYNAMADLLIEKSQ